MFLYTHYKFITSMKLEDLYKTIKERQVKPSEGSYVASMFIQGEDRIIQKVGEEAVEVVIAAKNKDKGRIVSEVSDLWFHLLILLVAKGISIDDILDELQKRAKEKRV